MTQVNTINKVIRGNRVVIEGGFIKALHSLPHSMFTKSRKEISEACNWARSTFDKKVRGISPFSNLEIEYLENFFRQHNIDAWTGESLNIN
jgi:hypothetical protein